MYLYGINSNAFAPSFIRIIETYQYLKWVKICFLIFTVIFISCDSDKEQKLFKEFIPDGYKIVTTEKGKNIVLANLNNDSFQDAAVLIAQTNNNFEDAQDVRIAMLIGTEEGEYKLNSMTGNLTSAFLFNNLTTPQIKVENRVVSAIHQSMRHNYELKFRYESDLVQ